MMHLNNPVKNTRFESQLQRSRLSLLAAVMVLLFFLLILRLGYLQFSQYKRYATLSLKNQMSIIPVNPSRGVILDKNGVLLASNIPVYALEIIPERVKHLEKTLHTLKLIIPSISDDDVEHFLHTLGQHRSYTPIPFKLKLTEEEVAIFASNQHLFPGVSIKARLMRYYPLAEKTAHLLGYVGRINLEDFQQVNATNYRATNFIGKTGIEKYYENILHGQVGYQQVETDVRGRILRVLSKQPPVSGAKIYLTIDARLQEAAYKALEKKRGAIVVLDMTKGDVLAMVSSPSYDPNLFVNGISTKDYKQLTMDLEKPLYNRAIRGLYPPASTIKPLFALAGLDKGFITPSSKIYDPGWYSLTGSTHKYRDWKRHGIISLKRAITVSCDTYFYHLGNKMGISVIEDTLMQFGFGQLSHIDLPGEVPGIVPSPSWKRRMKGSSWYGGDTIISAIGQGFTLASPLQMANATASLGQHGRRFRPHLLKKSVQDEHINLYKPLEEYPVQLNDEKNWDIIAEAMENVLRSREGTGHRFGSNTPYRVAAKTGTAQVHSSHQYDKKQYHEIPEALRDHSVFIAYAPVEKPEITIAVLVENDYIAPNVARKVMDAYFELNNKT